MATPQGNIYGTSLADLYARGMDISMQNPWALAQASFPLAQRAQPGITADQLLSGAQNYLQPQPQAMRPPMMMESSADALKALDQLVPGMTTPDVPMSPDVSFAGRAAALSALNSSSLNPANLAFNVMGMFAGPFGPIGAKLAKEAIKFDLNRNINLEAADITAAGNLAGVSPLAENDPALTAAISGTAQGDISGANASAAAASAAGAAAGEGGNTGVGTGEGPAGEGGGPGGPGVYKRGGYVSGKGKKAPQHGAKFHPGFDRAKGTKIVPIKAHEGEFVMNPSASKVYGPQLEAMNALIPPEALDSLIGKANRFFGG